ncbi:hypothetical protein KIN20_008837 [Parelaphostrongylus tenuis]|uniref:Galectin n=1 Tax=Parelaphostrongylus tenuis TaxID=148309 RepID=A0AAD5MPL9_PARTN|nr:hypothetical protein KIN20_008837 [Parelaphostrongylus tenuis]
MHDVHSPYVPTVVSIIEPLRYGCRIDIHAKVNDCPHKSSRNSAVELLFGPQIILHINFRFHQDHVVVMNSASYGNWGDEVRRHHSCDSFHLRIHLHHDHYEIDLNGKLMAYYAHRFPMESVQALGLKGDFTIKKSVSPDFNSTWNEKRRL